MRVEQIKIEEQMKDAAEAIDRQLGAGTARKNPHMVMSFINNVYACNHSYVLGNISESLGSISFKLSNLETVIEKQIDDLSSSVSSEVTSGVDAFNREIDSVLHELSHINLKI